MERLNALTLRDATRGCTLRLAALGPTSWKYADHRPVYASVSKTVRDLNVWEIIVL